MKPFIKWAGGKRWLAEAQSFAPPAIEGRYFEPFLGGAAMFFHLLPSSAILSDVNSRLIDTYSAIKTHSQIVSDLLRGHHRLHSKGHYYDTRSAHYETAPERAAQFLYLNRTCWNGLYRENRLGNFNVPIGTKTNVYDEREDFEAIANALSQADLHCCDFEDTIEQAGAGDFVFCDPPYTTAHNLNGFIKYNQRIFSWSDQIRLRDSVLQAKRRGAAVVVTNADHHSVRALYEAHADIQTLERATVISGLSKGRQQTSEIMVVL